LCGWLRRLGTLLLLLLLFLLLRQVVAYRATRRRSDDRVVTCNMSRDGADGRAFETSLGLGRASSQQGNTHQCQRQPPSGCPTFHSRAPLFHMKTVPVCS
jgi:hypothetical protein